MNENLQEVAKLTGFYAGQFWLTPPGNNAWFRKTFQKPRRKK